MRIRDDILRKSKIAERWPPARHAVVVALGGLGSTTLAYLLKAGGTRRLTLLGVDFGRRHRVELSYVERTAAALGARFVCLEAPEMGRLLGGAEPAVPRMRVPVDADVAIRDEGVPNRNALLLDIAVAFAVSAEADAVAIGVHAGDHPIQPDRRPEFIDAYSRMAVLANEGCLADDFRVLTPFLDRSKVEVVRIAAGLDVPFTSTWSCSNAGLRHCGRCAACTERRELFALAGVTDPTDYVAGDLDPCLHGSQWGDLREG